MGLRTAVSTSAGLAFAAVEYIAAAGLVAYVAGDSAWIAILTAGLLALLAWGYYGELNGMFPTAAAIRLYMSRAMDDRVALTITFSYMTTIVLVVAADAFIVGSAIAHVLGESSWTAGIWVAALLGVAMLSNLRGIRVAGNVQDIAAYAVLITSTAVAIIALVRSGTALRTPFNPLQGHSPAGFAEAVALGVFLYSAFEWVTTSAEEVRRPSHIHRGMAIAVLLLFVACTAITTAMSHVLTHAQLATSYPQLFIGERAAGAVGLWVMGAVTMLTAVNTFNGGFVTASRFIYATAREGSLPSALARLNGKAVPWLPVVALATASFLVAIAVEATRGWQVLVATGAVLESAIYAVAAYCVLRLRKREPDRSRPFRVHVAPVAAWIGIVVFGLLAVVASLTVGNKLDPLPLAIVVVVAGLSGWYVLKVLPKVRAREASRQASRARRRPPRPAPDRAD